MTIPPTAGPPARPALRQGGAALPEPDAGALARSAGLASRIGACIDAAGGWIPFDRYMELALYEPGLGYYDGAQAKFGAAGDFVTAPEISPLFARALAAQVAELFGELPPRVLEFGAGRGTLAADLIAELRRLGRPARNYAIVELSADLRARQQERLADAGDTTVQWLATPPADFEGVVIANEVLDVMPVRLFVRLGDRVHERGVVRDGSGLALALRPADQELAREVARTEAACGTLPDGYGSELGLVARGWTASLAGWIARGVALLVDYGFPAREYYHPQRLMGTLMCHYRHHAHADPLWLPGLNDITAHVDFSAIAEAGFEAGLEVLGYTSQAHFLVNCGLLELLQADPSPAHSAEVQRLVSEAEMGELLKVLALGRGVGGPLRGFVAGDRTGRL